MTSPRPRRQRTKSGPAGYKLAFLFTCAVLGLACLNLQRSGDRRSPAPLDPMLAQQARSRETMTYVAGYGLALLLTCAAFGLVYYRLFSARLAFYTVLGLGLAQMVVHFRFFLHIDLKRSARADLQLILFSALIVALMVGGTLVVLFNLRQRMM